MHEKVSPLQNKLLALLLKGGRELDSFTLFKRAKVGFSEFTISINGLRDRELVVDVDNRLKLSDEGLDIVLQGGPGTGEKEWRRVPAKYKIQAVPSNQPYTPSLRLLDRRTFKFLETNVT